MKNQVKLKTREVNEKPAQTAHLGEVQRTNISPSIPICRLCLQERDFYGNFAIVYDDGLTQHKTCMAKYAKNRRELKKIIFKIRYEEYYGDKRQAGIVDREAMKIVQTKSKREIRQERRQDKEVIKKRLAYARKCKEDKRIAKEEEINKWVAAHMVKKVNGALLIGETHKREETREGED
jgi:hypothetical protein